VFLTRECDYAIRTIRCLADSEKKSVSQISEIEGIPRPFAYKILKKLEHSGIVKSFRGPGGGYVLVTPPEELTLFSIVATVSENLHLNECLQEEQECPRNSGGSVCNVHAELIRVQELLIEALSEKSISELV